ncbi:MAG: hypothetical protein QM696_14360 [Steroidobacteraceae bacterium]
MKLHSCIRAATVRLIAIPLVSGLIIGGAPGVVSAARPDFSGDYMGAQGLLGEEAPGGEFGNTPDVENMITEALRPWARLRMDDTDVAIDDGAAVCEFAGPFRHTNTYPFTLLQTEEAVYIVPSYLSVVGIIKIHMTDKHPDSSSTRWSGQSIGHWEGDTLVVDTTGWNDKTWLGSGAQPHTQELHVIRRIRQVANGSLLEIQTTVSDRKALKHPYTYYRYFKKSDREFEDLASELLCNGDEGQPEIWWKQRQESIEIENARIQEYLSQQKK